VQKEPGFIDRDLEVTGPTVRGRNLVLDLATGMKQASGDSGFGEQALRRA